MRMSGLDLMQVNISAVREWIDALRSGEYYQGVQHLATRVWNAEKRKDIVQYCCMGVACELAYKQDNFVTKIVDHISPEIFYNNEELVMPVAVIEWLFGTDIIGAGFHNPTIVEMDPEYGFLNDAMSLAELNDRLGWDFNQIAEVIEEAILKPAMEAQNV